ncbi:hypothetical protein ACFY4B_18165 [Kitasatospora sp. NPDC001261]|uniref:hypothetical protein n=1 Tax=Kitasatospora sp. NPDC001261 TaxID=3364012 RepID=UPI0036B20AFA
MPLHRASKLLAPAAVLATVIGLTALTTAQAAPGNPQPASAAAAPAAGDTMPSAVEDFLHPGSERIFQEQKISLKQGDGHIMLTDCKSAYDIQVKSRTGQKNYCFSVNAKQGYLTMEIPEAYGIWTEDHPVQAKITSSGKESIVSAPKNDYTTFGEAGDSGQHSVLIELRVTG